MKCDQSGVCCRLFMINLTEEEYNSKTFETQFKEFGHMDDFSKAEECGANILKQNEDGSCIYLKDKKCSIHERRPSACRAFFCQSKDPQYAEMVKMVHKVKKEENIRIDF